MRKSHALLALIFLPLVLISLASEGLADGVALKPSSQGEWLIYDSSGQEIGTLALVEKGAYSIRPKDGQYIGIIIANGDLKMTGRHPVLTPDGAQLYLDALEAIKTLK